MVDKRFFIENTYVYVLDWKQPNALRMPHSKRTENCHLIVCSEKKAQEQFSNLKRNEVKGKASCIRLHKEYANGKRERIA